MKIILFGMFILIFSGFIFAQPKLNEPFTIKQGEKAVFGDLKLEYVGGQNGNVIVSSDVNRRRKMGRYLRYTFKITFEGETELYHLTKEYSLGDYFIQILSPNLVDDKYSDKTCSLVVMTNKQRVERKRMKLISNTEFEKLAAIETFALGGVGYAGTTSEGEELIRKTLSKDGAIAIFLSLLENGTPEAKLYALWALRKLNGRASKASFDEYRNLSTRVNRMSGCERFTEKFSESIKEIENPFYLKMTAKQLWAMDLEQRKAILTDEEEQFLLAIFRIYKSSGELDKIANVPFGKLFQKEANNILGK
jgi:hypothetical protein